MKHIVFSISLALLFSTALSVHAATDSEWEKARVVTIKTCLRNMNNGADYLDKINPNSLEELQSKLKEADKKNFQYLKGISVPPASEYRGWDDKKFHDYWSKTFVNQIKDNITPDFKKGFCKSKVEKAVAGIKSTKEETAPEEPQTTAAEPSPETPQEQTPVEQTAVTETEPEVTAIQEQTVVEPQDIQVPPQPAPAKKEASNTGAIVVLCILVVVVIALVGYALNVMKKNKARQAKSGRPSRRREDEDYQQNEYTSVATVQSDPEEESTFAAYSNAYAEPQVKTEDPRDREIERLRAEIASLQSQVNNTQRNMYQGAPRLNRPRVIYLSQANANGVFTRADARFNMGNSIFKLVTTDGMSGSFSVIEDPAVYELALMMPSDFLVNACTGHNLQLSEGARSIINEASGTAIFEDGRWRVSRKAQIRYLR